MTDTLRDKLIRKGWVTPFNAATLVRLIEEHYADEQAVPEGREPAAVISEPSDAELLCIAAEAIDGYGNGINPGDYEPATECAVQAYGSELCAYARAVLARWGNLKGSLTSSPPADGEVAELVAWLRQEFVRNQRIGNHNGAGRSADLRHAAEQARSTLEGWANYGYWVWPESALEQAKRNTIEALAALNAALADEPAVPEGREPAAVIAEPSDVEVLKLAQQYSVVYVLGDGSACHPFQDGYDMRNDVLRFARAVLARWGNLKGSLTSSPPADGEVAERAAEPLQRQVLVPVSVDERLPGLEDCDAEGRCWCFLPSWQFKFLDQCARWSLMMHSPSQDDRCRRTHWLPAHALPLPEVNNG